MSKLTLKTTITFDEPVSKVWRGLTDPAIVKRYFFGTDLASDWKVGGPITFSGEWEGHKYVDGGTILEIDPPHLLKYNYWSSMSGTENIPENYANVTYELSEADEVTTLTITQDNVKDQAAVDHSEQNWKSIFDGLKEILKRERMIVKTEAVNVDEFFVAGITTRTINNGQSRDDMIALWNEFQRDNIFCRLVDKLSDDIYCVYTEFETDHTGHYTAILGCKVKSLASVPDGFTGIVIPEDNYLVYHLAGKCPQNVLEAWEQIWLIDVDRKYAVDFDRYGPDIKSFEDSEVRIYLSVR